MNSRILLIPAALVISTALLATSALAQSAHPAGPESPYGGVTVEDIVARVNDQIITRSDYDRAMHDMDAEARQKGATMQEISAGHKDLLRNLIDQQLWLSKGKELDITGETELVNRLNEIRKQNNLETMDDLEKAAREQGISFEDFKANIRNSIITQEVMREEVGKRIQFTPGEARRYFDEHKQDYAQPESVTLAEILVSTGTPAAAAGDQAGGQADDPQKLAAAKAKADELEAKIHAGGDFGQLARSFSDGPTASEGGDLGEFQRDKLAKVLEDKTFALKSGQVTEPIQTRQGYVILKVVKHTPGGVPEYKDVESQVMDNFYMARMEPVMRDTLSTMREQAYIDVKPGFTDSGASPRQTKPIYSAYTPPAPKKKKVVERTRFRESTRSFRQKTAPEAEPAKSASGSGAETPAAATAKKGKKPTSAERASMKPGKKEKIRFGQAPSKTLPSAPAGATEDAGAGTQIASSGQEPVNPLETQAKPTQKTRYSARARQAKEAKQGTAGGAKTDAMAPAAPDAAEVADRQTQAGPLGLAGDTATKKKKKSATTTADKTRLEGKKKAKAPAENSGDVPLGPASATPAPAPAPAQ
ncbi:MAG: peptidylprolyl isomerase [Terracidiphilus sp.]